MTEEQKQETAEGLWHEKLKLDLIDYLNNQLKWLQLSFYEKAALLAGHLGFALIVALLGLIIFLLLVILVGLTVSELLGSFSLGFAITALAVLAVLALTFVFAKKIRRRLANMAVKMFLKIEKNEE